MKLIKFVCFTSRVVSMARGRQSSERISDIERDDERDRARRNSNNINNKIHRSQWNAGRGAREAPQRLRHSSRRWNAETEMSEYIEFKLSLASSRGHDVKSERVMPQKSGACLSRGCGHRLVHHEAEIKSRSNKRVRDKSGARCQSIRGESGFGKSRFLSYAIQETVIHLFSEKRGKRNS